MEKGLKVFGEGGIAAIHRETNQLHTRKVMKPRKSKELMPQQRKDGVGISHVPTMQAMWKNQGARVCRWLEAVGLHAMHQLFLPRPYSSPGFKSPARKTGVVLAFGLERVALLGRRALATAHVTQAGWLQERTALLVVVRQGLCGVSVSMNVGMGEEGSGSLKSD